MLSGSLIQDSLAGGWLQFSDPRAVVVAANLEEVLPKLREIEERVNRDGVWAAGYIGYEATPAFDRALRARPAGSFPLLCFGLYRDPQLIQLPSRPSRALMPQYCWKPSIDRDRYDESIARIRELIYDGDTYQVNYTLRLTAPMEEKPEALFLRMVHANEPQYGAYLESGRYIICCASPELFFRLDGQFLESRPMKGTTSRGLWLAQDKLKSQVLQQSCKNRAENLMIVDMVRNDMGRICEPGSVRVPGLLRLERYPTVWQMTSTVSARTDASVCEILRALFPPASITGAPKARTTEIIAELETAPRNIYTGCIGYIAPGRHAQFNVAIRTALFDLQSRTIEYGAGGGIVWDSTSQAEYEECLLKARIVTDMPAEFEMLETLLWEPGGGYFLLEEHLRRLADSSYHLGVRLDLSAVRARLTELEKDFHAQAQRIRLIVGRQGTISCESMPIDDSNTTKPVRLAIAAMPINSSNPFLYNKTTYRSMYDEARAGRTDCDDIVLWNERNEVTETTVGNIVVERKGTLLTPPVECGLLPGVFRGWLLAQGKVREEIINLRDLPSADRIYVVNSVRKWRNAALQSN